MFRQPDESGQVAGVAEVLNSEQVHEGPEGLQLDYIPLTLPRSQQIL
jgi:hypothetical protein